MKNNSTGPKKSSDFTLLFAEDNESLRALYQKAFTKDGFNVLTCDNAAQALADLRVEKVDLLVTDLAMPAANTLELFPILRKEYPHLPVIIVSGRYKDLKADFLDRGYQITAFLQKPIPLSELKQKIMDVLEISPEKV